MKYLFALVSLVFSFYCHSNAVVDSSDMLLCDLKSFRGDKISQAFHQKILLSETTYTHLKIEEELIRTDRSYMYFLVDDEVFYQEVVYRNSEPQYFKEIAARAFRRLKRVHAQKIINQRL